MFKRILHFIQYNNLTVLILAVILIIGSGAFAATDTGQAVIGGQQTATQGIDNTLLLAADLDAFDMDYQIERIEKDDSYYYVTYTYLDLVKRSSPSTSSGQPSLGSAAWEYQLQEKTRKITSSLKQDLGQYLAEELKEQYEARIKELKAEQAEARENGETVRTEVTDYSGLIGQTLDIAGRVFPGYDPVKVRTLPSPSVPPTILARYSATSTVDGTQTGKAAADNLTDIYNQYIEANDPDRDNFFGSLDNCPNVANPTQADEDGDGIGDACDENDANIANKCESANCESEIDGSGQGTTTEEFATSTEDQASSTPEQDTSTEDQALSFETVDETADTGNEPAVEIIDLPSDTPAEATGTE